ncbi:hypothetical protein LTR48_005266 [Friedmanniomyces endolithicus]|uniref:Zn(2)-C6 fungal-type domain-containing protein n=1 Tax=Rachicladosporium monterosium TaxID=1507873 RepID=A0ABR0L2Q7_9PEZI|nr:hypothetical protein LTR48_005266 [Friedmanniomyces endolithicus]KAK1824840.1 hypothetical protein LTR12_000635 [Friedmanniomyces endolithicus]KAK5142575.1 hypothetical protein LTR32_005106 [Rachicladosporium monterosium]
MPRPKKETATEPKTRSRKGCWPCKSRKVKCGEERPACANCVKSSEACDYSIRLNWGGRGKRDQDGTPTDGGVTFVNPHTSGTTLGLSSEREHVFSAQHIAAAPTPRLPRGHSSNSAGLEAAPREEAPIVNAQPLYELPPPQRYSPVVSRANGSLPAPYIPFLPFSSSLSEPSPPISAHARSTFQWSPQHGAKRVKLSPDGQARRTRPSPTFAVPQYPAPVEPSPSSTYYTPRSISSMVDTPATPGSSIASGSPYPLQSAASTVQDPLDLRRLSVKSLLSTPSEDPDRPRFARSDSTGYRTHGFDHGLPDLDLPHNDDHHILLPKSPDMRRASAAVSEVSSSSGEPDPKQIAFEPGGYYAQPVPVKIPRAWEPLPEELQNPMNLLYFHHFINHTGRIMVPHDCPENPFRSVLPQMAVANRQLLHLLLTYSASHRARLLDHPEPANRIADWMADVLPALRQALSEPASPGISDPRDPSSLAPLATAIMLASLEIVSPNTFAVSIPWQNHLQIARQMIVAKGGLHHLAQKADGARDKAIFFLSRWFAYLDVLGSLSGSKQDQPLYGAYLEDGGGLWLVNRSDEEIYQIDCFFGFSGRCIALLAQVAELAGQCDRQRIDPITNQVKSSWRPSEARKNQAADLQKRLKASVTTVFRGCMHSDPSSLHPQHNQMEGEEGKSEQDVAEIYATNEAYHWAGLIHLSRRVLAQSPDNPEVRENVQKILGSLEKVRRGSTAESCLLFPMFTAGCEAQGEKDREVFMERLRGIEGWGLQHVGRARKLMQEVWDSGRAWETLVNGEFFG